MNKPYKNLFLVALLLPAIIFPSNTTAAKNPRLESQYKSQLKAAQQAKFGTLCAMISQAERDFINIQNYCFGEAPLIGPGSLGERNYYLTIRHVTNLKKIKDNLIAQRAKMLAFHGSPKNSSKHGTFR